MENVQEKKGLSTGAKWGIGCGSGCLVVIVILVVMGIVGATFVKRQLGEWEEEFSALGFDKVEQGQVMEVSDPITVPTLYMAQTITITSDCSTNLAIMGQMGEIQGNVAGTVYFRGQMLIIGPDAVIEGDLDVVAQAVQVEGTVKGETRGTYQAITGTE